MNAAEFFRRQGIPAPPAPGPPLAPPPGSNGNARPEPAPAATSTPTGSPNVSADPIDQIDGSEPTAPDGWRATNSLLPSENRPSTLMVRGLRRQQVARLAISGLNTQQIADQLGIPYHVVRDDVKAVLWKWNKEAITDQGQLVQLELRRHLSLISAHWDTAHNIEDRRCYDSAKVIQRAQDAIARLLGLNHEQRVKLDITADVNVGPSPAMIQILQQMMAALPHDPAAQSLVAAQIRELAAANPVIEGDFTVEDDADEEE